MNQDEFLAKFFSLYATTFSRGNGQAWSEVYKKVLSPNIDYDKLYDYLIFEYTENSAPKPAFLLTKAVYRKPEIKDEQSEVWETLITRKGKETYEYGVKLANYKEHIEDFSRKGLSVIKLKFCKPEKDCPHCNFGYAGVCMTAKELRA